MTMLTIDVPDAEARGLTQEQLAQAVRPVVKELSGGGRVGGIWPIADAGPAGEGARVLDLLREENRTYEVTYRVTVPSEVVRVRPGAGQFDEDAAYLAAAERLIATGRMRVLGETRTSQETTVIDFSYPLTPAVVSAEVA